MIGRDLVKRCFVSLILLLIGTALAVAQPYTRRSSQMQHDGLKKTYEIANFKIGGKYDLTDPSKWEFGGEGGVTLESLGGGKLRTGYIAIGNARRNAAGEITNAVVISSYYSGDSTDMYEQWVKGAPLSGGVPIVGPGRPIDTDRYYVIMVDPLGTWGASKPSDGLGIKFPQYSYYDMVQANYRLLRDELKVARVALVTGVSMGGTQTYVWGVMHPEYIGAIMPIGGTTQSDGEDPVGNWIMATAASSLFVPESMAPNVVPRFREGLKDIQALFDRIIEQTFGVSEGIWIGTPINLTRERESRELERRMPELRHPHLVLWGEWDGWILPADLRVMADAMPDCRLVIVPRVGHSMNLEVPALYAGYFGAWFGGLAA